jgi:hypothetical protein
MIERCRRRKGKGSWKTTRIVATPLEVEGDNFQYR